MNVGIVGSSGYIAGFLLKRFKQSQDIETIVKIDQNDNADFYLDLLEPSKFNYDVLNDLDYIIFTAAISGPDKCAEEYEFCWKVNVTGTGYFIKEALAHNCRVIFFSSDAVFGDIPGEIYNENSVTKAATPYGCMKKAIEDKFKSNKLFKAIRLSYVMSAKDRFVKYCLECINNGQTADVFHPFYRNCISVTDVVNVVQWLILNWELLDSFVLNVAGRELVSRVRIADEINRFLNNKLDYVISTPKDGFYKNRPRITQMESLFLEQLNIINGNSFTEKIKKELEEVLL